MFKMTITLFAIKPTWILQGSGKLTTTYVGSSSQPQNKYIIPFQAQEHDAISI